MRRIFLVPGFFGFTSIGSMNYFRGVNTALRDALESRGVDAEIIECPTQPTGSIRRRAERVIETVLASGGVESDELHFVGHSTGGLDVRLMLTPGVRLRPDHAEDKIGDRTRSAVTVSTPHFGTPIANFFNTLPGRHVLELLTRAAASHGGRHAVHLVARAMKLVARLDDYIGRRETFLDVWVDRVIGKISADEDDPMWEFFRSVASDQGAIIQLTPEAMNLFTAAVLDRSDVDYGCVVTAAPPPPGHYSAPDALHLTRLIFASAFTVLHTMAGRQNRHYPYPHPGEESLETLRSRLDFEVDERTNDGIVPSLSQVHGEILDVAKADHLDVVGQYDTGEPHSDWLPCGAGYDDERFRATWSAVADHIAAAAQPRSEQRPAQQWSQTGSG